MGGELLADSLPGRGSCFHFTITLAVDHSVRIKRSPSELRGLRVLVVDDLDISRQILAEILGAWGFAVTEAANGHEALELLAKAATSNDHAFEMMLVDWKMPEMDGITVAQHVHEQVTLRVLPRLPVIIMVTAFSKDQLLKDAHGVDLDAVLTKPVTASGLFDTIMRVQGGRLMEEAAQLQVGLFEQAAAIRGARVLLVEDNDINQTVAQDLLERMGLEVTVAGDGQQALDFLEQKTFDVVLMDLQMPVMDGFEASRRIRSQPRFDDLPVIAMTAAVLSCDREACVSVGMNDHVAKPIVPQDLLAVLLKWVKVDADVSQGCSPPLARLATQNADALPTTLPGFDMDVALQLLGGNRSLFRRLVI